MPESGSPRLANGRNECGNFFGHRERAFWGGFSRWRQAMKASHGVLSPGPWRWGKRCAGQLPLRGWGRGREPHSSGALIALTPTTCPTRAPRKHGKHIVAEHAQTLNMTAGFVEKTCRESGAVWYVSMFWNRP